MYFATLEFAAQDRDIEVNELTLYSGANTASTIPSKDGTFYLNYTMHGAFTEKKTIIITFLGHIWLSRYCTTLWTVNIMGSRFYSVQRLEISLHPSAQNDSGAHSTSHLIRTKATVPMANWLGVGPPAYSAEGKNDWNNITSAPYAFMTCRENLTLTV
jgi:hypothetical protein